MRRHTSRSESISSDNDYISVRVDHNEFEGESMTGSPVNNRSKSLSKLSLVTYFPVGLQCSVLAKLN